MKSYTTRSSRETAELGRKFSATLKPGDIVALYGSLGSGKTQFVLGVCEGLGVRARVGSPTFTLINEYPAPGGTVVHVDLYRVESRGEIAELGLEEYFNGRTICLIEWAERVAEWLPKGCLTVRIAYGTGDLEREITIAQGEEIAA